MDIKQKNRFLIIGFMISILLCYFFAFSETIHVKKEYAVLKNEQLLFKSLPMQTRLLKQKKQLYDSLLTVYQIRETSWQNNLLQKIGVYTKLNNIEILKLEEPHTFKTNSLSTTSYMFNIGGDFRSILGLVYELEQKLNLGQIVNVHFQRKTDYRTKNSSLESQLIIQVVGNDASE